MDFFRKKEKTGDVRENDAKCEESQVSEELQALASRIAKLSDEEILDEYLTIRN